MRIRLFSALKYAIILILFIVCATSFQQSKDAKRVLHAVQEMAANVVNATVQDGWFPSLGSRLKYGTAFTWRNPSVSEVESGVLDPLMNDVFLAVKTGSEVMWDRIPVHLQTSFKRFPHHQIYADTDGHIGNESVVDVLAMLPQAILSDHQLKTYRLRRQAQEEGWGWSLSDFDSNFQQGWDNDKFKNFPMFLHAFRNAPKHIKWFVFMDDDTYIHTQSLASLLRPLNHKQAHYIGSLAMILNGFGENGRVGEKLKRKDPDKVVPLLFAHGGSGFVVSREAAEAVLWDEQRDFNKIAEYSQWAVHMCCGDALMGFMFREEIEIYPNEKIDPMEMAIDPLQGEAFANTVMYAADGGWCSRIVSWHHMAPHEIQEVFDWESSLQLRKDNLWPGVLYSDFYHDFVLPYMVPRRENWDNMAHSVVFRSDQTEEERLAEEKERLPNSIDDAEDDVEEEEENAEEEENPIVPHESADACERKCLSVPSCLGWKFEITSNNQVCTLEKDWVRRGVAVNAFKENSDPALAVTSGWIIDRVRTIRSAEVCDALTYDLDTQVYSDQPMEQEGWYFSKLREERGVNAEELFLVPSKFTAAAKYPGETQAM